MSVRDRAGPRKRRIRPIEPPIGRAGQCRGARCLGRELDLSLVLHCGQRGSICDTAAKGNSPEGCGRRWTYPGDRAPGSQRGIPIGDFVGADGSVVSTHNTILTHIQTFKFANSKNESLFLQRKNPRKIAWTVVYRRYVLSHQC